MWHRSKNLYTTANGLNKQGFFMVWYYALPDAKSFALTAAVISFPALYEVKQFSASLTDIFRIVGIHDKTWRRNLRKGRKTGKSEPAAPSRHFVFSVVQMSPDWTGFFRLAPMLLWCRTYNTAGMRVNLINRRFSRVEWNFYAQLRTGKNEVFPDQKYQFEISLPFLATSFVRWQTEHYSTLVS